MSKRIASSRRRFLRNTGALVVTFSLAGALPRLAEAAVAVAQGQTPPPAPAPVSLDAWIRIQGDGTVKVFTGRVDNGQGNRTALSQIVAEELDVPLSRVDMLMGDTALTPNQGVNWGSTTIQVAGAQLRQAAAEARLTLLGLASKQLGVQVDQLMVRDGVVSPSAAAGSGVSYASLIGDKHFNVDLNAVFTPGGYGPLMGSATPKDPSQYRLVGTSAPRVDIPPKVTGEFTYLQDVRVPGMLHGRVIHPTGIRSKLVSIGDFDPPIPGARVVHENDFVGVVADTEWDAIRAADALQVVWSDWNGLPDMAEFSDYIRATPGKDHPADKKGDSSAAIESAATQLNATYVTSFEMHASIGPSCAIADVQGDKATIWASTLAPFVHGPEIGTLLGIDPKNVRMINVEGSGSYGGNGSHIAAADAAIMSQLVGKPVRVQWMRHDEHGWELKGPAMVQDMAGGLDADGNVVGWQHEIWTPPHYNHSYPTGDLTGRWPGILIPGAFNTPLLVYDFGNVSIFQHDQADFAGVVRTGWIRGPAQPQQTFAMEAFMDELAAAAGQDPIQFRLRYMKSARLIDALNAVAQAASWDTRPSPGPDAAGNSTLATGRGVAVAHRDGTFAGKDGTLIAHIAEVQVNRSTGDIRVTRFWVAHDCGLIVNPKALQGQIESNVIQATSRALKEQVQFDSANVTSLDWRSYPILTFPEVPQIEIVMINRPDQPSTGAGEASTCPVAAAISNAVFDATGVRLRSLPFRPDRVQAAFAAALT